MAKTQYAASHDSAASSTEADVQALFAEALACHRARRFDDAAARYARILGLRPDFADAHCNLGAALADLDRPAEAEAAYRHAIALKPDFARAHNNLGNLFKRLGRLDEAVRAYRDAISYEPDLAGAHANLGMALADLGRLEEAAVAYRRAVALMPHHPATYNNLAATLRAVGRLDEAEAALRQAIALKEDYPEAHSNLGNVLLGLGRRDAAEAAFRRAIAIKPDYAEAHSNLGFALKSAGHLEEAETALRRAIEFKPDYPEGCCNLATVLKDQGKLAEAEALLRETIARRREYPRAWHHLANALMEAGRIADARAAAEEAVRLAPGYPRYFRSLGEMKRFAAGEPLIAVMEALDPDGMPVNDRIELHFGLAKAYEDIGRHDDAFRQLLAGNALKRSQLVYEEEAILGAMERIREVFSPDMIGAHRDAGDPSRVPVFIVGMMRSGTTLVEQILASHPAVFGAGELKTFGDIVSAHLSSGAFPDAAAHLSDRALRDIGAHYVESVRALAPGATRITDKMPPNFFFAGLIHLALPNAVIIHTVRDPVDTCLSCFSKLFDESQNHTYDLAELGRYYRHYRTLMAHWHDVLPPGRILDVRYEDVVADLEGAARRIVDHCGLPWHARCLDFHRTERPVHTASAAQVRRPIYASSVGRRRAYEHLLAPLLAELEPDTTAEALCESDPRTR